MTDEFIDHIFLKSTDNNKFIHGSDITYTFTYNDMGVLSHIYLHIYTFQFER